MLRECRTSLADEERKKGGVNSTFRTTDIYDHFQRLFTKSHVDSDGED